METIEEHTFHVSHLQIAISDQFLSQMVWIGMLMCTVSFRLINYMIFHFHSIPFDLMWVCNIRRIAIKVFVVQCDGNSQ